MVVPGISLLQLRFQALAASLCGSSHDVRHEWLDSLHYSNNGRHGRGIFSTGGLMGSECFKKYSALIYILRTGKYNFSLLTTFHLIPVFL
jgi:hypothetical protein